MAKYIEVEGNSSLVRDKVTGAILNINTNEIKQAKSRKKAWQAEKERVDSLERDILEIKALLKQILEVTDGRHND